MPINDNFQIEYNIPNEVKSQFTKEFLQVFQEKLLQIFPQVKDATYYQSYVYLESNVGWRKAFEDTCEELGCVESVLKYYQTLDWYEADLFDSEFGNLLVEYELVELGEPEIDEN